MWFLQPRDEDRVRDVLQRWLHGHAARAGQHRGADLVGLALTIGTDLAFAHGHYQSETDALCAATFCLRKQDGAWRITHHHVCAADVTQDRVALHADDRSANSATHV